jgi:hypothetical protein
LTRHFLHIALLLFTVIIIGCESQSPITQNDLQFTPFKRLPDTTQDYLYPIHPNPFNRVTGDTALFMRFCLHDSGSAIVLVQNAIGDAISEYNDSGLSAGVYVAHWQPLAQDGTRLRSGLYFITLHTKNYINSRLVNIQENE